MVITNFSFFLWVGLVGLLTVLFVYLLSFRFRTLFHRYFQTQKPSLNQELLPYLDGTRGLLALWVCLFHAWHWLGKITEQLGETIGFVKQGANAVPLFAIISGWLIFKTYQTSKRQHEPLKNYFLRRLLRIYPLYLFCIIWVYSLGYVFHPNIELFLSDIFMLRLFGSPFYSNPPAWSVYVEEGFYILLPLWFYLASRRPIIISIFTIATLLYVERMFKYRVEFVLIKFFFIGILVRESLTPKIKKILEHPLFLIVFIFSLVRILSRDFGAFEFQLELCITSYFLFIYIQANAWIQKILSFQPLRILGVISYSLYLVHPLVIAANNNLFFDGRGRLVNFSNVEGPVFSFYEAALLYPTAIIFYAMITYLMIERPFLNLRKLIRSKT